MAPRKQLRSRNKEKPGGNAEKTIDDSSVTEKNKNWFRLLQITRLLYGIIEKYKIIKLNQCLERRLIN